MAERIDKILKAQSRWDILRNFEKKHKRLFLKRLSANKGFRILKDLYQFAQNITDNAEYIKLNPAHIQTLLKTHFMFKRVNL